MTVGLKLYLVAAATLIFLDYVWLGWLMRGFYFRALAPLARSSSDALTPIWWAAIVVYLLIPAAIVLFVLPRVSTGAALSALAWGGLFGILAYGIYDFTNYSTLRGWSLSFALTDTLWGGIVCGLTTLVTSRFR